MANKLASTKKYTGCIFEVQEIDGQNMAELAEQIAESEEDHHEKFRDLVDFAIHNLDSSRFPAKIRIDKNFILEMKVELLEPIGLYKNNRLLLEKVLEEIMDYFWQEHKIKLGIRRDFGCFIFDPTAGSR